MSRHRFLAFAIFSVVIIPVVTQADWTVQIYSSGSTPDFEITGQATADQVISGLNQEYQVVSVYSTSNTQDNFDGGGPFGIGSQIVGLPPGDNDNFVFQGIGNFNVTAGGLYYFLNNTDDGSQLRISINGGEFITIISDDVLSQPHTVSSGPISLDAGDTLQLEWTWFEATGGAEGETFYSNDPLGVTVALWEDPSLGLSLVGGTYTGTVYKATLGIPPFPGTNGDGPDNLLEADDYITHGALVGSQFFRETINFGAGGHFSSEIPFPDGTPADHFVVRGTGNIHVEPGQEGDWTFFTNTDDGAQLRIESTVVIFDNFQQVPSDSAYVVYNFFAPGDYAVEYTGFEKILGESFEVLVKQGDFSAAKGHGDPTGALLLGAPGGLQVISAVSIVTEVRPDSVSVTRGTYVSGGVVELAESDNTDLSVRRATSDIQSRTEFKVKAISPVASPLSLQVTLEGSVFARSQVNQTIELLTLDGSGFPAWEQIDTRAATRFTDSNVTVTVNPATDLSRFVDPLTMCIEARVRYQSVIPRQQFTSNTDQFIWIIGQ